MPDVGSEFGEEEDVKPSIEYLDSLNEYRKRSRSVEDVGEGSGSTKMPRTANGTPEANGTPAVATITADVEMHTEVVVEVVATSGAGDPMVTGAFSLRQIRSQSDWRHVLSQRCSHSAVADHGRASGAHDPGGVHDILRNLVCSVTTLRHGPTYKYSIE